MSYFSVSDFYKQKFGSKVYKISIDAGCTCPTRDGSKSTGGCIFCSAAGSGDFAASRTLSISEQIEEAKKRVDSKFPKKQNKKYIAYFQNFTNTYGDEDALYKKYMEALSGQGVVGLAIATRPDCISDKMLNYLEKLSRITYLQLELGFQTSNEKTAGYINRCYENKVYDDAMARLKKNVPAAHIVTHVIFGLPFETEADMLNSVDYVLQRGTDGIKITVLYVLKGTKLEKDYYEGKIKVLEMEEYLELVIKAIEKVPEDIVVHRFTGDPPKSLIIAPLWTTNKKLVLNSFKALSPASHFVAEHTDD